MPAKPFCSGQAAINAAGQPLDGTMEQQLELCLSNLQEVLAHAGAKPANIVRLNLYTNSIPDFFQAYGTLVAWIRQHEVHISSTLLEVSAFAFPQLKVELEATAVVH
ncbi:RidA family protein [Mucilaginibacter limnophilus]|uniref:RidA family protein n=1 Tax=Mucilaginibacter limnophilus TaxID=1932778 RepID=A0A3S3TKI1_9SPHI|nr:RidA family protein [Mucilaginibacter limnophilus]RVU03143.1 RidA family protein [Mucilaginibacter limnophilus]